MQESEAIRTDSIVSVALQADEILSRRAKGRIYLPGALRMALKSNTRDVSRHGG